MADTDCIFCRIAAGEMSADIVRSDDHTIAFRDIDPQAPVHVLVVPRRHITAVDDLTPGDAELMGRLFLTAKAVAEEEGVADSGYRLVVNNGRDASQSVDHIHMHVIGGRDMTWPPG